MRIRLIKAVDLPSTEPGVDRAAVTVPEGEEFEAKSIGDDQYEISYMGHTGTVDPSQFDEILETRTGDR